jgi:CopG antitoxin of type II toxin-antitoxin system
MTKRPVAKPVPEIGMFLDDEEKAVYEAIERPDYVPRSILTAKKRAEYRAIARANMNEGRVKISLRLPESDLERLKAKALREGLPYQSLIGSILHKAVS